MVPLTAAILALGALGIVLQDAFEVMLLPRRVHRRVRLTRLYFKVTWFAWSTWALLLSPGRRRERFLSVFGALSMVVLFALWASLLIISFGTLEWIVQNGQPAAKSSLTEQIYMSGVTFFTLGYGDVVPHSRAARALSVVEAGTGIGFIAVVIGYLPVLYQLFSRRKRMSSSLTAAPARPRPPPRC